MKIIVFICITYIFPLEEMARNDTSYTYIICGKVRFKGIN